MSNLIGISGKQGVGKDTVAKMIQYLTTDWHKQFSEYTVQKSRKMKILPFQETMESTDRFLDSAWNIKKMGYKLKQITSILLNVPVEKFEDQEYKKETLPEQWWYWYCDGDKFGTEEKAKEHSDLLWSEEGWDAPVELIKPTVRQLLQEIGTEAMRDNIHPHIWSNALFAEWKPQTIVRDGQEYRGLEFPKWIITDIRFPNEAKAIKDRGGVLIRVNRTYDNLFHNMIGTDATTWKAPSTHPSETSLDNYKDWDYVIDNDGSLEDLFEKVKEIYESIN